MPRLTIISDRVYRYLKGGLLCAGVLPGFSSFSRAHTQILGATSPIVVGCSESGDVGDDDDGVLLHTTPLYYIEVVVVELGAFSSIGNGI